MQEGADSTEEDNKRHHFETPWSVMMVKAAGPLQGNLTPQQKVWLFRQHEAKLYEHHVHMYELAEKVRTCTRCNRRQVVFEENQECKSCMGGAMFSPENDMSLGPMRMQEQLTGAFHRAELFSTFAKASPMEINLVRSVLPVMRMAG